MQTLESLGVPASAFLLPHSMPEAGNGQQAWGHPQHGFPPSNMEQGAVASPQPNHIFVMNNVKPEQPRREEVINSPAQPPTPNPSVITATYNPTYNRCLPKILSDLDCEMKIKQVLRCIENILLENGDVDLQQQAYKLPDRSSSPQFAKTKKPKFKEDEEMSSPGINLPLASNPPATLINKGATKNSSNNIKINVKVEPDADKTPTMRPPMFNEQPSPSLPHTGSFPYKHSPGPHTPQSPYPPQSPMTPQTPGSRYPYHSSESYANSPHHHHTPQPMIPHIQLSQHLAMSSPHLAAPTATSSPHLHHLHASSPHIHQHAHSPHITHGNSPHMQHSPIQHQTQTQTHSPHLQPANGIHSPQPHIPIQQYQVIHQEQSHDSHSSDHLMGQPDYHFPLGEGVQAGGFKHESVAPHTPQQPAPAVPATAGKKEGPSMQDFVLDPALFAQYLAANQQQLQQLQIQLHQQQLQHTQLQQQRQQLQQQQAHHSPQQPQQPQQPAQQQAHQPAHPQHTQLTPGQLHLSHLIGDPAHPIAFPGVHPMSLSGHLLQQIGHDGTIRLEEDDKWILSLLNMDSSIAHDLSLSGQIPPL